MFILTSRAERRVSYTPSRQQVNINELVADCGLLVIGRFGDVAVVRADRDGGRVVSDPFQLLSRRVLFLQAAEVAVHVAAE